MKSFHKKRLLKLASFLRTLPKERFNLEVITGLPKGSHAMKDEEQIVEELAGFCKGKTCGSAACAIGWCPAVFPRDAKWETRYGGVVLKSDEWQENFGFAEEFFGLTEAQAVYLFDPSYYPCRRQGKISVANRIADFVSGKMDEKWWAEVKEDYEYEPDYI